MEAQEQQDDNIKTRMTTSISSEAFEKNRAKE